MELHVWIGELAESTNYAKQHKQPGNTIAKDTATAVTSPKGNNARPQLGPPSNDRHRTNDPR